MEHQFKPGDLALTLVGIPAKVEAGSCVEVFKVYSKGDEFEMPRGTVVAMNVIISVVWEGKKYGFHPSQLMPLRGDFAPDQQKAKEVEPCV